jgi:hypothetical protein
MRESTGKDKREFFRYAYSKPMKYNSLNIPKGSKFVSKLVSAMSKNLSTSGILFTTETVNAPTIASILVLDLDYRTASICKEIETRALILENKLIGRVVRIDDNGDDTLGIGVAFVTKSDPLAKGIKNIENLIKRS